MGSIYKIETDKAPKAIGPYSQAIHASPFLFLSGMLPIDPAHGKIIATTIESQTTQVLLNIQAILNQAGLDLTSIVRMEVFLQNLDHFQAMNKIYAQFLSHDPKPARHAFQVARLPLDALLEITCTARTND